MSDQKTRAGFPLTMLRAPGIRPTEAVVWAYIDAHHGGTTGCKQSVREIADGLNVCTKTVLRACAALENAGYLHREVRYREDGGQTANAYFTHDPVARRRAREDGGEL